MNAYLIEELYRKHYCYLFRVAYRICDSYSIAKDIVNDGFVKVITCKVVFLDIHQARRYVCACIKYSAFERFHKDARQAAMRREFVNTDSSYRLVDHVIANVAKIKSNMSRTIIEEIYLHHRHRKDIATERKIKRATVHSLEQQGLRELYLLCTT